MITVRPYQAEAREALRFALKNTEDNPAVVIPTGGGKSFIIADCVSYWKRRSANFRVCILAHRKELVQQNADELRGIMPGGDIGVYSAGLNSRDTKSDILFAGIDSVYNKADAFDPFSLIIVDEAHRIPVNGEGKYRRFIADCKARSKKLRVVGFTATPFRLDCGPICGKDFILNRIVYQANVIDLIQQGYLSRLDSMVGDAPDLKGVHTKRGDYDQHELSAVCRDAKLVKRTVLNALDVLNLKERKKCIWFCVDIAHCESVLNEIRSSGDTADMITGTTPASVRDSLVERFKNGEFRHLLNVSVFCEGFNVKDVDAVVLLRPSQSKGLYWQMVGRGLRTHPNKDYCAILDYANMITEHGPLTDDEVKDIGSVVCENCNREYSRALDKCPRCGTPRPKERQQNDLECQKQNEYVRRMHDSETSGADILGVRPTVLDVDGVYCNVHRKEGAPPSLRISWRCGVTIYNEWLCVWHPGAAGEIGERKFAEVTGCDWQAYKSDAPYSGLADLVALNAARTIGQITVKKDGQFMTVTGHRRK